MRNKSLMQINLSDVKKLANYNKLNYALARQSAELTTTNSVICNDMLHVTIHNRWHYLLSLGKLEPNEKR